MALAYSWLVLTAGVFLATILIDGVKVKGGFLNYLIVAAIFGVLNFFLGWVVKLVAGVATLGILFFYGFVLRVVADAVVLRLASGLSSRLDVRGWGPAFGAGFVMALVGVLADWLVGRLA